MCVCVGGWKGKADGISMFRDERTGGKGEQGVGVGR